MNDEELDYNELFNAEEDPNLVEIPSEFHSEDSGLLFKNCLVCEANLQDITAPYVIEKAYKQYANIDAHDVIFEYAMCLPCAERKKHSLSEESQEAIQNYFLENVTVPENVMDTEYALGSCWFKGTAKSELREFQIFGLFKGDKMIANQPPYLIGEAAIEEMANLLSNKTIEDMDRFIDKYFGGPPELRDLLKNHKVYLL